MRIDYDVAISIRSFASTIGVGHRITCHDRSCDCVNEITKIDDDRVYFKCLGGGVDFSREPMHLDALLNGGWLVMNPQLHIKFNPMEKFARSSIK